MTPFTLDKTFTSEISTAHIYQMAFAGNSTRFSLQMVPVTEGRQSGTHKVMMPDDEPVHCIIHHQMLLARKLTAVSSAPQCSREEADS